MKKNNIKIVWGIASISIVYAVIVSILLILPKDRKMFETENINTRKIAIFINEGDGNYTISNSKKFPKEGYVLNTEKTACKNGTIFTQDSITKSIKGTFKTGDLCNLYFDKEQIVNSNTILAKLNLIAKEGNPIFANVATTDETKDGLYAMEDDYGTSYYFRGAVENNYIKFADFYWRIIRINGDGSLRIIYDGTSAHANGVSNTNRLALSNVVWNSINRNDTKYVGYMYGGANGSVSTSKEQAQTNETNTNIKTQLENWYKTNIRDKGFDEYVANTIYCNDRSIPGKEATGWSSDTELGYGNNLTAYGATARSNVWNSEANLVQPKLKCNQKNDAFTKADDEKGNGKLEEKVGLITADEIVAAGSGKYDTSNQRYYLYKEPWYWSLSPRGFIGTSSSVLITHNIGNLLGSSVANTVNNVAPVISLIPEYVSKMIGNGTIGNEYRVE